LGLAGRSSRSSSKPGTTYSPLGEPPPSESSVKAWMPATLIALVLAIGIGAAAYVTLGRGTAGSASLSPTLDLHSDAAVIAAVRAYYGAEDKAGETGSVELVRSLTTGPGTPAYENLKQYFIQQAAKNRHSVTVSDRFGDWRVAISGSRATANYSLVQVGHDTDASSGMPVEADVTTPKAAYRATLQLIGNRWLLYERDYLNETPG
jgi:hypothetical protein